MIHTHFVAADIYKHYPHPIFWRATCQGEDTLHLLDYEDVVLRARVLQERRPQSTIMIEMSFDQRVWIPVAAFPRMKGQKVMRASA